MCQEFPGKGAKNTFQGQVNVFLKTRQSYQVIKCYSRSFIIVVYDVIAGNTQVLSLNLNLKS